jgi:hypothetical protein
MERIRGQERKVFWPLTAKTEFLNAQPLRLRVFHLQPQRTRRFTKSFPM